MTETFHPACVRFVGVLWGWWRSIKDQDVCAHTDGTPAYNYYSSSAATTRDLLPVTVPMHVKLITVTIIAGCLQWNAHTPLVHCYYYYSAQFHTVSFVFRPQCGDLGLFHCLPGMAQQNKGCFLLGQHFVARQLYSLRLCCSLLCSALPGTRGGVSDDPPQKPRHHSPHSCIEVWRLHRGWGTTKTHTGFFFLMSVALSALHVLRLQLVSFLPSRLWHVHSPVKPLLLSHTKVKPVNLDVSGCGY